MDIRFACPHCAQHIVVDESGAGLQIECPDCHSQLAVPAQANAPARKLPLLVVEKPAEAPAPEPTGPPPPVLRLGKRGKGAKYRCTNPGCRSVWYESQLRTQQVVGKTSVVCPKCRMNVARMVAPPGLWSRMFKKK